MLSVGAEKGKTSSFGVASSSAAASSGQSSAADVNMDVSEEGKTELVIANPPSPEKLFSVTLTHPAVRTVKIIPRDSVMRDESSSGSSSGPAVGSKRGPIISKVGQVENYAKSEGTVSELINSFPMMKVSNFKLGNSSPMVDLSPDATEDRILGKRPLCLPVPKEGVEVTPATILLFEKIVSETLGLGHEEVLRVVPHLVLPGRMCFRPLAAKDEIGVVVNLLGPVSTQFGKRKHGQWSLAFVRLMESGLEDLAKFGTVMTELVAGVFAWDEWTVPASSQKWQPVRSASIAASLSLQPRVVLALGEPVQYEWRKRFGVSVGQKYDGIFFYKVDTVIAGQSLFIVECCHPSYRHPETQSKVETAIELVGMLAKGVVFAEGSFELPGLHINQITWYTRLTTVGNKVYQIRGGVVLRDLLKSYGMWDEKNLPNDLVRESYDVRMALFAGIIDGDGYYSERDHQFQVAVKDENLMSELVQLTRSLGFCPGTVSTTKCVHEHTGEEYKGFRITIGGRDLSDTPVVLHYKKPATFEERGAKIVRDQRCGGFRVSKVNHAAYYGIKLNGNARCLMSDFVVTHNCLDYLTIGIQEIASISERRIERLVNPVLSGLPAFLVNKGGLNSGFMIAHVSRRACYYTRGLTLSFVALIRILTRSSLLCSFI